MLHGAEQSWAQSPAALVDSRTPLPDRVREQLDRMIVEVRNDRLATNTNTASKFSNQGMLDEKTRVSMLLDLSSMERQLKEYEASILASGRSVAFAEVAAVWGQAAITRLGIGLVGDLLGDTEMASIVFADVGRQADSLVISEFSVPRDFESLLQLMDIKAIAVILHAGLPSYSSFSFSQVLPERRFRASYPGSVDQVRDVLDRLKKMVDSGPRLMLWGLAATLGGAFEMNNDIIEAMVWRLRSDDIIFDGTNEQRLQSGIDAAMLALISRSLEYRAFRDVTRDLHRWVPSVGGDSEQGTELLKWRAIFAADRFDTLLLSKVESDSVFQRAFESIPGGETKPAREVASWTAWLLAPSLEGFASGLTVGTPARRRAEGLGMSLGDRVCLNGDRFDADDVEASLSGGDSENAFTGVVDPTNVFQMPAVQQALGELGVRRFVPIRGSASRFYLWPPVRGVHYLAPTPVGCHE